VQGGQLTPVMALCGYLRADESRAVALGKYRLRGNGDLATVDNNSGVFPRVRERLRGSISLKAQVVPPISASFQRAD
jgi:hypothetical protein